MRFTSKTPLSAHDERAVAVAAEADPRSVRAVLVGRPTASTTRARVIRALRACGFTQLADGVIASHDDAT